MTLPEAVTLLVWLAVAVAGSKLAGDAYGAAGYVAGFLGVFGVPLLVAWAVRVADRHLKLWPDRSAPCFCGAKTGLTVEADDAHGFTEHCSCGARFVQKGQRVFMVQAGGLRPYMRWRRMRGWSPCADASVGPPYR